MQRLGNIGEAVLITEPSNLFYFSEYNNSDAKFLYYDNKGYYFTDSRYFEEIKFHNKMLYIQDIKFFDNFISDNNIKHLFVENSIQFLFHKHLKNLGIEEIFFLNDTVDNMRSIKNDREIEKIKKAQEITDKTFKDILNQIKEGITEYELNCKLSSLLYKNGAEKNAFDPIVAFGNNTSKPHAHSGNKKLTKNMPILLDFGAKYENYCSDMTRTFYYGAPDAEFVKYYNTVLNAQNIALEKIKAGMTGKECDSIARDYFKKYNLDSYFLHSLGHSLGIDIHENPNFSPRCESIIESNMVLSVEPAIYFENKYGIRIEDIIIVGKNDINNLTKSEKRLIIV